MKTKSQKIIGILLFILSGLLLLLYPMVVMANIMSLAAFSSSEGGGLVIPVIFLFMMATMFYPVTYGVALYKHTRKANASLKYAFWPYWHLLAVVVLAMLWSAFE